MRLGTVIGRVTLSQTVPALVGARWLIGVPFSLKALKSNGKPDGEDQVIFDNLSAGTGSKIGFTEGAEAAAPFHPEKKPVDAFCACILDHLVIHEP